ASRRRDVCIRCCPRSWTRPRLGQPRSLAKRELPNSFVKRRLGIPPGQQQRSPLGALISFYDQADWVPVGCLLLRPIWRMGPREAGETFLLVAVVHVPINAVGYLIGARINQI